MYQVNGKAEISTPPQLPHFSADLNETWNQERYPGYDPTCKNLVDTWRREGGLRRESIFRYFLCSIYLSFFVFLLTPTGHTRRPITTVYGSKTCFRVRYALLDLSMTKIMFGGRNSPKTRFWGSWICILSQICKIFESRYVKKYALDQHEIWKGISGAQMDFVGGPALQNYNSKWRQPPSWIFAQTSIT